MRTFIGDRCIQLLGLEAIEALAAKSEGARAHFEQVRWCVLPPSLLPSSLSLFIRLLLSPKPAQQKEHSLILAFLPFFSVLVLLFSSLPLLLPLLGPTNPLQEAAESLFESIFELYPQDKDLQAAACQVRREGEKEGGVDKHKKRTALRRQFPLLVMLPIYSYL